MDDVIILNENTYVGNNTELLAKTSGEPTVVDIVGRQNSIHF
jgi:hypothetical protein